MKLTQVFLSLSGWAYPVLATSPETNIVPLATVKNGTLQGLYLADFQEDIFLGVPFAEPPVGDLRLRHPVPYQENWEDIRNATTRSFSCTGYAGFSEGLTMGEGT
jgi:cholinesterase